MSKKYQGFYKPINPHKYVGNVSNIVFRSGWERKFMIHCDTKSTVLRWGSETVIVPYRSTADKRMHRYYMDFWVESLKNDGSIEQLLIEVKPNKETRPPVRPKKMQPKAKARYIRETLVYQKNIDKWKAATKYAERKGMRFVIMDEYSLGIKKRK